MSGAMETALPDALLARFCAFVSARVGLHFPPERWADLEDAARRVARDLGCESARACIEHLLEHPPSRAQVEALARYLTIGETYFFRDRASFACLEQHVLPELIEARRATDRRLRIWSAGCSTGEEPYSVAMLLAGMLPDLAAWDISILATDINPQALQRAARGVYSQWSFRDAFSDNRERYFKRTRQGEFELDPHVRRLVTFAYLNLADDSYPSVANQTNAIDIILCRNVLMYFQPARIRELIGRLTLSLLDGGWLFLSPVEMPHVAIAPLATISFPGAMVYRKALAAPEAATLEPLAEIDRHAPPPTAVAYSGPRSDEPAESFPATSRAQAASLYEQGRYVEAAAELEDSMVEQSADANAMALLARSYANQGRLIEAALWCQRAAAADKLNPSWCYLLATILQEQGHLADAMSALRRALYLDPNYALAHVALGNLTGRQGRRKDSERHFRNALAILSACREEDALPEGDGITAGKLAEIIRSTMTGAESR